ncbi:MAG: tyrosine-type recombinase/integrase [Hungatella sp.]
MKKQRYDSKGRKLPEGFAERAKEHRYLARFTIDGKRYIEYGKTIQELKKIVAQRKVELESGILEPEKITLNVWFDRWLLTYKKDSVRPQTYTNYQMYYKWYIKNQRLGKMQLGKIRKTHVLELCKSLLVREKPLSIKTVKYIASILSCCLEEAVENDLITRNPAKNLTAGLSSLGREDDRPKRDSISEEQQSILMDYICHHRFYRCHKNLIEIMFGSGMRIGEICALTWQDIDFQNEWIRIDKTLSYRKRSVDAGREKRIGSPKTAQSVRTVPMLPSVKQAFIDQKKMLLMSRRVSRETINGYHDFVFLSEDGTVLTPDYVTAVLKKIVNSYNREETELAKKEERAEVLLSVFSAHWTRHTFRSRCFQKEIRHEVVQAVLGHKPGSAVTDAVYLHIDENEIRKEFKNKAV